MGGLLLEGTGYLVSILTPCIDRQAAQTYDAEGSLVDSNLEHRSKRLEGASFDLDLGKHVILWLGQGPSHVKLCSCTSSWKYSALVLGLY